VICNRADYEWACAQVRERHLVELCEVLFSPSHGQQDARTLAEWILEDRLPVRFQVQLHKVLWGEERGR
jgi:7-carboxy-7-deazaguanine synthase